MQEWSLTLYGTSTPAAKNDPIPFRNPIIRNKGNASRPVVLQAGRKNNRGKIVPVAPTYSVGLVKRKKNKNSKNPNRNSQKSKQSRPGTRTTPTPSAVPPVPADLSLHLRADTPPGTDARGRKMSNLFEQYPKIQRIYPAPLQAHGTSAPVSFTSTSGLADTPLQISWLQYNNILKSIEQPIISWLKQNCRVQEILGYIESVKVLI